MQIKFEATELKKAKKYIDKLIIKDEETKIKRRKKSSSFIKDLFKFLFK